MVKSRAEIQKAYRQRLKEKDNARYLARERMRRKASCIPSSQLSKVDRNKRNQKNREYLRLYKQKQKELAQAMLPNIDAENEEAANTSGYESSSSIPLANQDGPRRLVVQIGFPARARGSRVRMQNALCKYEREIQDLKEKYKSLLQKKYRSKLRAVQISSKCYPSQLTPSSKTNKQVKSLGLNKGQVQSVRKQLLFSNVLCIEVEQARKKARKHQRYLLHNLIGGKILRKYRCVKMASKETGLCRNKLGVALSKCITPVVARRRRAVVSNKENVISFLERDENSRTLPGKKDYRKENKEKKQVRVLTDYLSNLHRKYISENPKAKLSLASFCRIRPKNLLLASFISRSTCLCTRHQNMSLTLKSARSENVKVSINGDKMLETKEFSIRELQETVTSDEIVLSQWKRVAVEEKGKKKMLMRVVSQKLTKQEFVAHTEAQVEEFASHVTRVKMQYQEMRLLKDSLPENHVIVQMDFSEIIRAKL